MGNGPNGQQENHQVRDNVDGSCSKYCYCGIDTMPARKQWIPNFLDRDAFECDGQSETSVVGQVNPYQTLDDPKDHAHLGRAKDTPELQQQGGFCQPNCNSPQNLNRPAQLIHD